MTKEEAITELSRLGIRFKLMGGSIRTENWTRCPIVALAEATKAVSFDNSQWDEAAETIGLPYRDAREIVEASDYPESRRKNLRRKLLDLCI